LLTKGLYLKPLFHDFKKNSIFAFNSSLIGPQDAYVKTVNQMIQEQLLEVEEADHLIE
jgi:hypothetical protein